MAHLPSIKHSRIVTSHIVTSRIVTSHIVTSRIVTSHIVTSYIVAAVKRIWLCLLLGFTCQWAQASDLSASVDREKLYASDTLTLTVRHNGRAGTGGPNFSQLKQHFDILSNNRSNQYRNINGQVESFTQWQLTLAPKSAGKRLIPSFRFQGAFSDAIEIDVLPPQQRPPGEVADIFAEAEVSKQQVYVQQQLLFKVRLYTAVSLQSLDTDDFTLDNARLETVSEYKYRRQLQGKSYIVIETIYAIFPQNSGELILPPTTWTVEKARRSNNFFDPFNSPNRKLQRLRTKEKRVSVLAKPNSYPDVPWLPAEHIKITQRWSDAPDSFRVGEPITRAITVTAKGLTSAQLPPLAETVTTGIKIYPDQAQTEDSKDNSGITGIRVESQAIVPTQSGVLTLPAITVLWWDTVKQKLRRASLPAQDIVVAPGDSATITLPSTGVASALPLTPNNTNRAAADKLPWQTSTLILAVLSLMFATLWWRSRGNTKLLTMSTSSRHRAEKSVSNEKQAYKQLKLSCQSNDLLRVREALLAWARQYWHNPDLTQLAGVAELTDDARLKMQIQSLNTALYSQTKDSQWNSSDLLLRIDAVRAKQQTQAQPNPILPPLYGNID